MRQDSEAGHELMKDYVAGHRNRRKNREGCQYAYIQLHMQERDGWIVRRYTNENVWNANSLEVQQGE